MNPLTAELIAVSRYFGVFERETVCCGTVTHAQCIVLQRLTAGAQSNSALAGYAGVSGSAMTRLVDGLEKRDWIERRRESDDRRKISVCLTKSGRTEATRLLELTDSGTAEILAQIPEASRQEVLHALAVLRQAIEATRNKGASCC